MVTTVSNTVLYIGGGNGNPLQRPCLENPRDGGAWWATVYGVAQSRMLQNKDHIQNAGQHEMAKKYDIGEETR